MPRDQVSSVPVSGPAALALPGSLLELQNLGPHLGRTESESVL